MPKTRTQNSVDAATSTNPVHAVRDCADALFRAATECCRQHERVSRLHAKSNLDEELKVASEACEQCHDALRTFAGTYERTAADVHPRGSDEEWWHSANALWLASREYLRRTGGCDKASRELKDHGPDRLDSLHMEYELEGSALLALRHAADAYQQNRPTAA